MSLMAGVGACVLDGDWSICQLSLKPEVVAVNSHMPYYQDRAHLGLMYCAINQG